MKWTLENEGRQDNKRNKHSIKSDGLNNYSKFVLSEFGLDLKGRQRLTTNAVHKI